LRHLLLGHWLQLQHLRSYCVDDGDGQACCCSTIAQKMNVGCHRGCHL